MIVKKFEAEKFRNLRDILIEPCRGVNILCGENGQGKTNLIEGIWLSTGFKSFRTKKSREMIPHGEEYFKISMDFFGENRLQNIEIKTTAEITEAYLNRVKVNSTRNIIGEFFSVVFSPSHLNLIKGGPEEKRKFLDIAISQNKPSYAAVLSDYYKVLKQKNTLLKNCDINNIDRDMISVWDESLAKYGGKILTERKKYIEELKKISKEFYGGISGNREELSIQYNMTVKDDFSDEKEAAEIIKEGLESSLESDIKRGATSKGPHRDDVTVLLEGENIRSFGSQGQQRSAALSMKLGEAYIINKFRNERPVALLDDVMSELDVNRQNFILNELNDWQVFITCCEPTQVLRLKSGKTFEIEKGKIKR